MPAPADAAAIVERARSLLRERARVVLAVSGGLDSMVLLHAVAEAGGDSGRVMVATFDHGTGAASRRASDLVEREGARLGFPVRRERARLPHGSEAEWRAARWGFLRECARHGATIVTAHTRDDQVETVVFRIMRGAGARGIAGLDVDSDVARPFLDVGRAEIARYAATRAVPYVDDPSNRSRRFARNRIRLDLLPAFSRVRPEFDDEIIALARRAAVLRREVDVVAAGFIVAERPGAVEVDRSLLATLTPDGLRVVWPAVAARAGVALDRRGTLRLSEFTMSGGPGRRIQLSGGVEVVRQRDRLVLTHRSSHAPPPSATLPLDGMVEFGAWRFVPIGRASGSLWEAELPGDARLGVRRWRPGDRIGVGGRSDGPMAARRVKRFLAEARISPPDRRDWPVVIADGEIVWIPGVRRTDAAAVRSGRPVVRYICERHES